MQTARPDEDGHCRPVGDSCAFMRAMTKWEIAGRFLQAATR